MGKAQPTSLTKGWQWRRLGDCVRLINGRAYSQHELLDSGTPVIRIQNLNGGDRWYYSNLKLPEDKYCHRGDLLFAWSASFGPYIWCGEKSIFHYHIWRVIPNDCLDKAFAFRLLEWLTDRIRSASHGVAMLHMTKAGMEAWDIPLPPIPEQIRIAAILDQANALRVKRREALVQLDSLTQAIFIEMFGDGNHPVSPLEDVCELITDGTHQTPTYAEAGVIFLSAKNVTSGYIDWENIKFIPESLHLELHRRLAPKKGDILLAKNGTTGVAAIVDRDCTFDIYVSLALLRAKQGVLPTYLLGAINSPICKKQFNAALKGIGVPNLHLKEIRATKIPLPPMSQQEEFSERIEAVEKLKRSQGSSLVELDNLFASLQHRAFRGELV
jgi:type I restriction enzyme S subunit